MKKLQIFLLIFLATSVTYGQQRNERLDKAKELIDAEFKENMNDYSSYSPVSYSSLDTLYTSIFEDKNFIEFLLMPALKEMEKLNKVFTNPIDITYDAEPLIKEIDKDPSKYKEELVLALKTFDNKQKMMLIDIKLFVPEFIGWKLVHKYRSKNEYNALILYEYEFFFNKDMTAITSYSSVKK